MILKNIGRTLRPILFHSEPERSGNTNWGAIKTCEGSYRSFYVGKKKDLLNKAEINSSADPV